MEKTIAKGQKLYVLEGVRAIACIAIYVCHFKGAFLPSSFPGWLWNSPLKILFAGTPFVRVFFTLSGFVVAYKYFTRQNFDDIWKDIPRRYVRLLPMLLLANLAAWLCMKCGLCYNAQAGLVSGSTDFLSIFNTFEANLKNCLYESFVGNYLGRGASYTPPFWTIEYEFLGVLLVLAGLSIFRMNRIRWLMYVLFLLLFNGDWNYLILGLMTADLYVNTPIVKILSRYQIITGLFLIGLMLLFGSLDIHDDSKLWRIGYGALISSILLLLLSNDMAGKIFGCKAACFLGRISFGIYAFHWLVIITLSSYLYLTWGGTRGALIANALISLIPILALAYAATLITEHSSKRLLQKAATK